MEALSLSKANTRARFSAHVARSLASFERAAAALMAACHVVAALLLWLVFLLAQVADSKKK